MLKLSLPMKPANLDYGVVYSCSAAPEPAHAAHTIKCHITWNLEALFGSESYSASTKECGDGEESFSAQISHLRCFKARDISVSPILHIVEFTCNAPRYMCALHLWNILQEGKGSQVGFSSISQHPLWHYKHWLTDLESLDRHPAQCWQ